MDWHNVTCAQTASELKTDMTSGLSSSEAKKRLEHYGKNILRSSGHQSVIVKFFSQFADFMVLILLAAAGISFFTSLTGDGNFTEPVMILLIVILNAAVGTVQECRAENGLSVHGPDAGGIELYGHRHELDDQGLLLRAAVNTDHDGFGSVYIPFTVPQLKQGFVHHVKIIMGTALKKNDGTSIFQK